MRVNLPWPPSALSPNARKVWAKINAAKAYRLECRVRALEANIDTAYIKAALAAKTHALHVFIDFYPPDRRSRDDDNLVAAFKSGRDGVADALGIDDKHFVTHPLLRESVVKGGQVTLTFTLRELEARE